MNSIEMPGGGCVCPRRKPKDIRAIPVVVLNSRLRAIPALGNAFKSKQEIMMPNINDEKFDRIEISSARSKLQLLQDLFVGAGYGENLDLSEMALDGLTTIFREIGAVMEQAEAALPISALLPVPERRIDRAAH